LPVFLDVLFLYVGRDFGRVFVIRLFISMCVHVLMCLLYVVRDVVIYCLLSVLISFGYLVR